MTALFLFSNLGILLPNLVRGVYNETSMCFSSVMFNHSGVPEICGTGAYISMAHRAYVVLKGTSAGTPSQCRASGYLPTPHPQKQS